jgi:anti-sigma regulatory factor (Ser/Thr protein kinase)
MSGGTGAVSAGCSGARLASAKHRFGVGTASRPWPVHSHLPFAALPSAVSCARLHVRSMCLEWGLRNIADTAELLASELMTNAVQASGRLRIRADLAIVPVVNLWLVSDGISLVIHVWDASDEMPVLKDFTADDEGGRGLMLVEALGKEWGAYRKAEGGKVVWVMVCAELQPMQHSAASDKFGDL